MEKSIRCDCIGGEHYLHFYFFKDEPQIYVDMMAKSPKTLGRRIQDAINALRGREYCYDGICLNKEKSQELINYLRNFWEI